MKPRPSELPTLETERLLLRAMREDDAPALFAIYGDPEVMRYASDDPFPDLSTVSLMLRSVTRLLAEGQSLARSACSRSWALSTRQEELRRSLRTRRARLQPAEVGLPAGARRPGTPAGDLRAGQRHAGCAPPPASTRGSAPLRASR